MASAEIMMAFWLGALFGVGGLCLAYIFALYVSGRMEHPGCTDAPTRGRGRNQDR